MARYVFVTGGVLSSLGKGITASSIGAIFKAQGYSVMIKKFDPYLNYNPGLMSPLQHGEVFVTEDGCEGDLDLGHYERFINENTNKTCDQTSGFIYYNVIEKERKGGFLGGTVQVIPHVTDEIKHSILEADSEYDIVIVEIGGTVGDIEGLPFLEAIRQLRFDVGDERVAYVHVTPVFYMKAAGELKTKPAQHSVQKLREIGISPDMLICRSELPLSDEIRRKLALFCNVKKEAVMSAVDAAPLYQVVMNMYQEGAAKELLAKFQMENRPADLSRWEKLVHTIKNPKQAITIAIVGKYVDVRDAYISLSEAMLHAGSVHHTKVEIKWIAAENLEMKEPAELLEGVHGILIPGGFGERGMQGKINATNYARNNDIPYLGVGSLGMQCAIIEYARSVLKIDDANCVEVDPKTKEPIITYIDGAGKPSNRAGEMRLGAHTETLAADSLLARIYGKLEVTERHRHRLEFNDHYRQRLIDAGMSIAAVDKYSGMVEAVELASHRWFIGCQFIPEYKSRPLAPHPIFVSFIAAALEYNSNS
ncbi:MAG: CTP synthase [Deferribacteraceae bacterium]|jgi:CTP synthase|nr:CTP synthase [Deferribacteraceae bacterium]